MLSKYFEYKIQTQQFKDCLKNTLEELKNKKVLIYGAGEGFFYLNKIYNFTKKLDIVAIADKKYEDMEEKPLIDGIQTIAPGEIVCQEYDYILITNEASTSIFNFLMYHIFLEEDKIKKIFEEEIKDERNNLCYLYEHKFNKTYPKLVKKLKNKKVVLYGAGVYLELIAKIFGLDGLNVIGVADLKYENPDEDKEFCGFKTYAPDEIKELNPDYVVVCTKFYVNIVQHLYDNVLCGSKIKIRPLVKKSFWTLVKEIWG